MQPLQGAFESLTDALAEQRRHQALGRTLTMVFLAMVSGEDSERGIGGGIEERRWRLKGIFGFRQDAVPCYRTIRRASPAVDAQELEAKLVGWATQVQAAVGSADWEGQAMARQW